MNELLSNMASAGAKSVPVYHIDPTGCAFQPDELPEEQPLEIRLQFYDGGHLTERVLPIRMRTPGHDDELAAGFLFTEALISDHRQIAQIKSSGSGNIICVELRPGVSVDLARLERLYCTPSSCGANGKMSLKAVRIPAPTSPRSGEPSVDAGVIEQLPEILRSRQSVFDQTGDLHAAALFDVCGRLLAVRADVGRLNALDRLIGAAFLRGRTPLTEQILLLSGRVSFELIQKAGVAGVAIVAATGAPSSLAVELAESLGMTVAGFVRADRFNVYTGEARIRQASTMGSDDSMPSLLAMV